MTLTPIQQEIKDVLPTRLNLTSTEIAEMICRPNPSVRRSLVRLYNNGMVERKWSSEGWKYNWRP